MYGYIKLDVNTDIDKKWDMGSDKDTGSDRGLDIIGI